jgi:acyl-CoA reductase-like NAD-dependent aldehyde dehydrogenase
MADRKVGPVIDGQVCLDTSGKIAEIVNPATGEVVAQASCAGERDVARAVQSSERAFRSASWQSLSPADRGRILLALADRLEQEAEQLIELEMLDTGKPISQLRGGEIPLSAAILRYYAGAADKIEGSVKNTPGGLHFTQFQPYGVVAGILPWNYPLVNVALKVAPALAAGNAIVLKPSVETPLATVAFGELCQRAAVPQGIVNVVVGYGSEAGTALVAHQNVKKVSFTGSTEVGQTIQRLAADQMKLVNLECGGKNAIVVFADADLDRAANAVLFSAFVNSGQLCVSCSRLLVEQSVAERFESILVEKLAKIQVGDPRDESTLIGPMITQAQYELALRYLAIGSEAGCKMIAGGSVLELPGSLAGGYWIQPTILSGVQPDMQVAQDEIFGPALSILRFETEQQAVAIANGVCYGLSGSVWTRDVERAGRMVQAMDTGLIWVNTMLAGYPQIPLSPHKMSGTGVELGMEGLMAYCQRKSAVINYDSSAPVGWEIS